MKVYLLEGIQMLNGRVLVAPDEASLRACEKHRRDRDIASIIRRSKGLASQDSPIPSCKGVVMAVPSGCNVKVGDVIHFRYNGYVDRVLYNGKSLVSVGTYDIEAREE